jgi:hypothetical protein
LHLFDSLNPTFLPVLDSAAADAAAKITKDATALDIAEFNQQNRMLRLSALSLVLIFTDSILSNDLDEDELPADRFAALLAGFSGNEDRDEVNIDQTTLDIITAHVKDAMESLGISDSSMIDAAFGSSVEDADQALQSIAEIVESHVPTDDDKLNAFVKTFVYGDIDDSGKILDSAAIGSKFGKVSYKANKAVRNGKITVANKRVGEKAKLSVKQKAALTKAREKAFSSAALSSHLHAVKKDNRAGLY